MLKFTEQCTKNVNHIVGYIKNKGNKRVAKGTLQKYLFYLKVFATRLSMLM